MDPYAIPHPMAEMRVEFIRVETIPPTGPDRTVVVGSRCGVGLPDWTETMTTVKPGR